MENNKIQVKYLPKGAILWDCNIDEFGESDILGIKDITLSKYYYEMYCIKLPNNPYDYELIRD